jgi:hypothetical protein
MDSLKYLIDMAFFSPSVAAHTTAHIFVWEIVGRLDTDPSMSGRTTLPRCYMNGICADVVVHLSRLDSSKDQDVFIA